MKIYLPTDNVYNKCYVVQSEGVIRAYDTSPSSNTSYNYRDYYINSDYIYKDGSGSWSNYGNLPICLDNNVITHDFYYRLDITDIFINVFIIGFICLYIPFRLIFGSLFGKRLI